MGHLSIGRIVSVFCVWACAVNIKVYSQYRQDYTYYPETRAWFKIHKVPTDWNEARLKCYFEGGNLASPINDRVYAVMRSLMLVQSGPVFTGVHMMDTAGDYYSIEGIALDQMPIQWAKGEPNNLNNTERSLAILPDGTFADVKSSNILPYICYKPKTGNESISSDCGTNAKGYELDPVSNSCYKYHGDCVVWHRAHMVCSAEGGHLVILNNDREAQLMFDRYSKRPVNCNGDDASSSHRFYYIGFHNIDVDRAYWFTLDGRRIEEAGYSNWAAGEPSGNHERCGTLLRDNSGLNDISCDEWLPFICEITNPKTAFNP
ncbi:unnamed protein product [Chilo suppressalis]|uniref:C-type lectin domain-containing protein n=1 Tax=Chilo suppressalis TaxID=168631 RepID=A0ABN8AUP7_CHISP|nr:hypothetical protein evm_005786 [Chilo suppressalis]CAH0398083.1 unnamed protein product [Chilo suppressalis]